MLNKKCVPCSSGSKALTFDEATKMLNQLKDWTLVNGATWLQKDFKFPDFTKTLEFVNKVGQIAEEQGHHPDIYFTWGKCQIRIQTHKINGLHENDFILASKIDKIED